MIIYRFGQPHVSGSLYIDDELSPPRLIWKNAEGLILDLTQGLPSVATWGDIIGLLSDQTDLQGELEGKAPTVHVHSAYILHSLATAVSDFLVASGAGAFVKKTLAETLVILGKAAASGLASLDANSKLVQARARGDDGILYTLLANDTLAQAYATNSVTKLTVTAARTLTTTVPAAGCRATTIILTSGTVSYVITFGAGFKPTATLATGTVSGRVFIITWVSDGVNLYEEGRTAAMVA